LASRLHDEVRVRNLAPGSVQLTFATPSGESASSAIELTPGQQLSDLRVVLQ